MKRTLIFLTIILVSCSKKSYIPTKTDHIELGYELINQFPTSQKGLYYKTYGGNDGYLKRWLRYQVINEENRKENFIVELERHVDFDTIFSVKQRHELDSMFENLKEVQLQEEKLDVSSLRRTDDVSEVGKVDRITFPVFQTGEDGRVYAFMFYSSFHTNTGSSEIYVFRREKDRWQNFAKVFVAFNH
ncbi:hypothetical protein [Litoribacter populi]|uniref:hypothetical protein n=1 Tax=Litoribacter populi TaxID=2598460 RepID=UPI00117F8BBE|nr:hypothetical protein [Litoribacter populi]